MVYGYKLIQLKGKDGIQYMVVLDEECQSLPSNVVDSQQRRLLVAALTHIYMSGGPVKEDDICICCTQRLETVNWPEMFLNGDKGK
ncbi:unnamed protein product, partial [Iphiclides podalirius]